MIQVEKKRLSRNASNDIHAPIGFVVYPENGVPQSCEEEELHVELTSFQPESSVIRLVDNNGRLLLQEDQDPDADADQVIFTIRNIGAGTYFFEVSDGFYYQVKEVRIPD
ncbi:MAG: hypothetical protein EAZ89_15095 [Bacteroidetes bacterium]|nr:MAG: hypothetical protein EAZ89_15095 [Bacteroidota bacterium]